jgi:hypothetical protein
MSEFYEDDEPIEDIAAMFGEGPHALTQRPRPLTETVAPKPFTNWYATDPVLVTVSGPFAEPPTCMGRPMRPASPS